MKHILLILLSIISITGRSQELTLGMDSVIQYTQKIGFKTVEMDSITVDGDDVIRTYVARNTEDNISIKIVEIRHSWQSYDKTVNVNGEYVYVNPEAGIVRMGKQPRDSKSHRVVIYDYSKAFKPIPKRQLGFMSKGAYGNVYKDKYVVLTTRGYKHYK